jgi:phosphate starvation-inducible PhoH-like protein
MQQLKIIVTGDMTQTDLRTIKSGLSTRSIAQNIDRLAIVHLDEHDIVRHPLVQEIVKAYEERGPRRRKIVCV